MANRAVLVTLRYEVNIEKLSHLRQISQVFIRALL